MRIQSLFNRLPKSLFYYTVFSKKNIGFNEKIKSIKWFQWMEFFAIFLLKNVHFMKCIIVTYKQLKEKATKLFRKCKITMKMLWKRIYDLKQLVNIRIHRLSYWKVNGNLFEITLHFVMFIFDICRLLSSCGFCTYDALFSSSLFTLDEHEVKKKKN